MGNKALDLKSVSDYFHVCELEEYDIIILFIFYKGFDAL